MRLVIVTLLLSIQSLSAQQNDSLSPIPLNVDSGTSANDTTVKVFYDSLFASAPVSDDRQYISEHVSKPDYILPLALLLLLAYFTWLRYQYAKEINENVTALFNMNLAQQFFRDKEFSLNIFSVLLYVNAIFVFGIYIFQLCNYYGLELPLPSDLLNIALCMAIFPCAYVVKSFVYFFLRILFDFDSTIRFFRFNSLIIYQLLSIALLPCVILISASEEPLLHWVIFSSYIIAGLAFLFRLVKGFSVSVAASQFHLLYFLLYICALEIAPLLIVYKTFVIYTAQ